MALDLAQFKRTLCCQGQATAGEVAAAVQEIRAFDAQAEQRGRMFRWTMLLAGLGTIASFLFLTPVAPAAAVPAAAVCGCVLIGAIIVWSQNRRFDLANRRYELLEELARLLGRDMPQGAPLTVSLDLAPPNDARKKTGEGTVRDWKVTHFADPWLKLSGRLADGTAFNIALVERYQARKKWARSRSGKSKLKSKTKIATLATISLFPKQKRYGNHEQLADRMPQFIRVPAWARVKKVSANAGALRLTTITGENWAVGKANPKQPCDGAELLVLMLLSLYQVLHASKSLRAA
jgi:hypothetical protein